MNWAVLGYTGLNWTVLGCAGPINNELKGLVKMIKVRNAVIDRYWAVLDCSGLCCALMGSTGLSWAANGRDRVEGGEGVMSVTRVIWVTWVSRVRGATEVTRVIWVTGEATDEGQRRKERKSK